MVTPKREPGWNNYRVKWQASTKALSMRCDPELYLEVRNYALRENLTLAEAMRTLLTIGLVTLETKR